MHRRRNKQGSKQPCSLRVQERVATEQPRLAEPVDGQVAVRLGEVAEQPVVVEPVLYELNVNELVAELPEHSLDQEHAPLPNVLVEASAEHLGPAKQQVEPELARSAATLVE